jgi:hypothetical protein
VERAHEVAAYVSSAPGKGGEPIYEWLEVRPVMDESAAKDWLGFDPGLG